MSSIHTLATTFLLLMVYSFIGWVYESIVMSIEGRKLVNRGFLVGPYIPIYGFGALLVLAVLGKEAHLDIIQLFLLAAVLDCTLEYLTSWAMEKMFHARWWDYSNYKFNINGRVCLLGFVAFGALSVLLLKYIHPFVMSYVNKLSDVWLFIISGVLFVIFLADLITTVRGIVSFNKKLAEIQTAINKEKEKYLQALADLRKQVSERASDMVESLQKYGINLDEIRDNLASRKESWNEWKEQILSRFENSEYNTGEIKKLHKKGRFTERRLLRAFPKMRSTDSPEALEVVRKERNKKS